jgi:hypothetical protein
VKVTVQITLYAHSQTNTLFYRSYSPLLATRQKQLRRLVSGQALDLALSLK